MQYFSGLPVALAHRFLNSNSEKSTMEFGWMTGRGTREPPTRSVPDMAFDPIEAALRQLHASIAGEVIPDDIVRLLQALDELSSKRNLH